MASNPGVFLPTGQIMPILGLGTWQVSLKRNSYCNSNRNKNNDINL